MVVGVLTFTMSNFGCKMCEGYGLIFFMTEGIWKGLRELTWTEPMHVTPELTGFPGLLLRKEYFSI
jgi:hypothetical protein